jgi:hypothetical protein
MPPPTIPGTGPIALKQAQEPPGTPTCMGQLPTFVMQIC